MADKKQCPICAGQRQDGLTTFTVDLGFGVIVVRHVPANLCSICGEEWLDDATAAVLEKIVEGARTKHRTVEVAEYEYEKEYSLAG
jgi:YgiT-type zinc finger domain-containing protein